ncbi:hypothetical protein EDC01DRAFT_656330 [Geopyxis carbonaria]|nr:hypothetical protein EDC01DRAFT_656330 [Geopyxis carbonaria]
MRASALFVAQAALSSAFVIPNGIPVEALENIASHNDDLDLSLSRIVRVPCLGCKTKDNIPSDLILDFNLPASSPDHITLNGVPVLPINTNQKFVPIKAPLVPSDTSIVGVMMNVEDYPKAELDYSLLTSEATVLQDGGYKQDTLELRIAAVDGVLARVSGVKMNVQEDLQTGKMAFGKTSLISPDDKGCFGVRCMVHKMLEKVKAMKEHTKQAAKGWKKGCKGKGHKNAVAAGLEGLDMEPVQHARPFHGHHGKHHDRPHHGQHHGHHGHHGDRSIISRIIGQVLFPILIGILAGMFVSAVGLFIGHLFMMLVHHIKAHRQARREGRTSCGRGFGRCSRKAQGADIEAEKGLLENEELNDEESTAATESTAPPAYVDAGIEVVEKE